MDIDIFKIKALTNMHVGGNNISYGVIDKLVQRDPATSFPVIHASSLKGAINEHCQSGLFGEDEIDMVGIFGNQENSGQNKFFSAHLLTMPVRSNIQPWFNATCPALLKDLYEILLAFGLVSSSNSIKRFYDSVKNLQGCEFTLFTETCPSDILIEDWNKAGIKKDGWELTHKQWFGPKENLVILRDDIFNELCENLPVVARNRIDEPRNLWYEELVPRQSVFWTVHLRPKASRVDIFENIINKKFPLQIGANATVGMGYCTLEKIILS